MFFFNKKRRRKDDRSKFFLTFLEGKKKEDAWRKANGQRVKPLYDI